MATEAIVNKRQAALPDRRHIGRRRRRRRRSRGPVRDVALAERARQGGGRAGRSGHQQDRARPEDQRRMARQGLWLVNRTPEMLASLPKLDDAASPTRNRTCRSSRRTARTRRARSSRTVGRRRHLHAPRLLADVPPGARDRPTSGPIGSAASSARATSRSSISPAACSRACRRRRTS